MRGAGITALLEAGIDVVEDVLTPEVEALDPAYFHHRRSGRPRFTLKAALTLDGQIAAADGSSQWISGVEAREDAHRLRAEADAVMVGAGSVRADDPRLTVRLPGHEGPQPRPVVVVGRGALSPEAAVWGTDAVVVATRPTGLPAQEILVGEREGWPDLGEAALRLAELGLIDILVEGGQGLAASLLAQGLIDRGVFYLAAKLAGGAGKGPFSGSWTTLRAAREIEIVTVRRLGDDLRVEWVMDVHRNH
jgi:diaminohydroxyphosphoribosylaminopyrimidine deaminase/5-amino-6-(5-phosphoribosylamino)uracil reductase